MHVTRNEINQSINNNNDNNNNNNTGLSVPVPDKAFNITNKCTLVNYSLVPYLRHQKKEKNYVINTLFSISAHDIWNLQAIFNVQLIFEMGNYNIHMDYRTTIRTVFG